MSLFVEWLLRTNNLLVRCQPSTETDTDEEDDDVDVDAIQNNEKIRNDIMIYLQQQQHL
jgi:hypothetical protein